MRLNEQRWIFESLKSMYFNAGRGRERESRWVLSPEARALCGRLAESAELTSEDCRIALGFLKSEEAKAAIKGAGWIIKRWEITTLLLALEQGAEDPRE